MVPASISSKTLTASSTGRFWTTGTTKPSAPNWRLLPSLYEFYKRTNDLIPSNTVFTMLRSIISEGRPTATTRPPARTESTAWLKATLETAVTTAEWAPPFVFFFNQSWDIFNFATVDDKVCTNFSPILVYHCWYRQRWHVRWRLS